MANITDLTNKSHEISVLCVDDDTLICENLGRILQGVFSKVKVVSSGVEGMNAFGKEPYDIVLADIIMPKMTGIEMVKKIREAGGECAVVFLSGSDDSEHLLEAIDLHADGFITKPLDVEKMFETLSKIIDGINSRMLALQYGRELEDRVIFEMQKNIEQTRIMLQQSRLAQIGEMITAISHLWKEPLCAINQLVQDIPDAFKYNELNEEYINRNVEKVACQIDYLTHTIDDFTNFFKANKTAEHFTFHEVLDPVLTLVEKDFKLSGITIQAHLTEGKVPLYTFKNELKQVIMNLLQYAKQEFARNGVESPLITLSLREEGESLYFSVKYNGGSKSSEALESIFEYDFDEQLQPPLGHIGLYLTKKIVNNNLGGDIVAGNDRDGVIFVIRLNKEK